MVHTLRNNFGGPISNDEGILFHRCCRLMGWTSEPGKVHRGRAEVPTIIVLCSRGSLSAGLRVGHPHRVQALFGRRRWHAPVVTRESLAVLDGKVYASGLLEGLVCILSLLGDRACTCLAERMAARCAECAAGCYGCLADVADPHVRIPHAICPVQLDEYVGKIVLGKERFISTGRTGSLFRKLTGRTVNPIFFKELPGFASVRHGGRERFDGRQGG